jgi:hypothetical protein
MTIILIAYIEVCHVISGSLSPWHGASSGCGWICDLYSSPTIVWVIKSRRMRWAGHVACMGEGRVVYRVLVGKPEGKRPLGKPRHRWEHNIKAVLQEVGCGGMGWIEQAKDRERWWALVNFLTSCKPVSFSRRTVLHGVSK